MSRQVNRRGLLKASALVTIGSVVAACAPQAAPTPAPATKAPAATPAAAPTATPRPIVELIISRGEHPSQAIIKDAPAHVATGQATGVRLNFQPVPSADYGAKLRVWMASRQVPDIIRAGFGEMREFADPAVFRPVLPLIDKHGPNLRQFFNAHPDVVRRLKVNGELYIVPSISYNTKLLAPSPCIRKDLLDKIGMPFPDTFEKLYEALRELKKANPGILGYTGRGGIKRNLMIVAYPYGSGLGGWMRGPHVPYWEPTQKRWLYGPIHPEFKDVLAYFARLHKEQLLDPDFAVATPDQWHERNSAGKGVFTWDNFSFCVRWNKAIRELDPKATWTPFPIIKGTRGARQNDFGGFAGSGGGWCIGAGCKHPERAIELMDWMITPIGVDTRSWGIQDTHYTLKGTRPASITDYTTTNLEKTLPPGSRALKPDIVEKYRVRADPFRSFQSDTGTGQLDFSVLWDDAVIYTWDPPGEVDAWYAMSSTDKGLHTELLVPSFTAAEVERLRKVQTDVNAIMDPALDKMVLGQMPVADYDKAVQDAIKAGAQDLEKIYNEAEVRG